MEIHVVQSGETINSIADKYGVPVERVMKDNGLHPPYSLVVGQCIVIMYPSITHTVQEGDTLESIASEYSITVIQLLRNNPFLSDREYIYPGEILVISYGDKKRKITVNGYANPFIKRDLLRKTLPYLTYLTIFGYRVTQNADITEPNDEELIQLAKEYLVAPIMLVSTLSFEGVGSAEAVYKILSNDNLVYRYIENILTVLRRKGFSGVSFIFSYLITENVEIYNNFTKKVTNRLNNEGFIVLISIPPMMEVITDKITFERIDYSDMGNTANQVVVMNYSWGYNFGPPMPSASVYMLGLFLDYLITLIPPEKMIIGLPLIGYVWELPYIIGVTRANALTYDAVINIAKETGSEIQFDEISQNPFFDFTNNSTGIPIQNTIWFVDVRSILALTHLVDSYNTTGIAIWNIMVYSPQLWLVINAQYDIETILTDNKV